MKHLALINSSLKVTLLAFLTSFSALCFSQPLQINVTVTPPYSVHLSDYVGNADNVLLSITNTSNAQQNFKLIPTMTGDNGVSATVSPNFQPSSAINIQPFQTLILTFTQLQQYNSNITENDIDLVGYSNAQLIQTEALPEGNYTLCVKAFDYGNGGQLSSDFGCATFPITHFDPPIIITPPHESNVPPINPQNIVFTWTPSGQPGITNYLFEIIDMTQNNLLNPNDAFQNLGVQKYVVQDLVTSQLVYSLSYPPLNEGHQYAVRVTAYDPMGNLSYKNLGRSPVSSFKYKFNDILANPIDDDISASDEIAIPDEEEDMQVDIMVPADDWLSLGDPPAQQQGIEDPEDSPGCIGTCAVAIPYPNNGNTTVQPGDEVVVGKFKMNVISTNGNNSGQGTILVNWLKTSINVQFNNISVNNDMQMYGGEVFAKIDGGYIAESIAKDENVDLDQLQNNISNIQNQLQEANRRISNFSPDNQIPISLPIALDNDEFDLAIVGLIFKHDIAYMNVLLPVQIPEALNNDYLNISTSGICIRPNGMGVAGKISLKKDVSIQLTDKTTLKFNKTATFVDFDCGGVTKTHVDGEIEFDRDLLLPLSNNGDVLNGEVKAQFSVDVEDGHNWMAENVTLSSPKFTTPTTKGFIFSAQNLKYDHSDYSNPANIDFPNNYPTTDNTWKGLYIQNIGCQLPNGFQQGNDPLSVQANHLFIDKYGFSGEINAQNLIDFNSGKLDGWKFSIDEFGLEILNSGLESGSFAGDVRIPISETALSYNVVISAPENENSSVDFEFVIGDLPDLEVDMWIANLALENSTVDLTKEGDNYKVSADLNGSISIAWGSGENSESNAVSSFGLPSVEFQNLTVGGGQVPSISDGSFGIVNNLQGACASFPITLSEIDFDFNGPQVGIKFNQLGFTLANIANGLSGNADFTIFGKWNQEAGFYKYEKTQLNSIHVDADLVAAKVEGFIDIYVEDDEFGNGFRGSVDATIKTTNMGIELTLQAGKTLGDNGFRYFYFDGLLDLGDQLGIPLGATGVALYGFGGGMWYNMNRSSQFDSENPIMVDEFDGDGYNNQAGATESGVVFTPQKGKVGFNASVLFGIYQARDVFNGDLEFGMQLDVNDLSLDLVYMSGNGYVMQSPTGDRSPESSLIAASVDIEVDPDKPMFHCLAGIDINLGIASVSGTINMHYETVGEGEKLWYFKVGSWNESSTYAQDFPWEDDMRFKAEVDLKIIKAIFHGYFMTGNDIPGLPPLPKVIRENLDISDDRDPTLGSDPATGIAVGAGIYVNLDLEFLIFYANVKLALGADILIKDYGTLSCGEYDPIGVNGWYASGQAYGYFKGEAGLHVDLWFFEGKVKLMSLEASAAIFAQAPNPMYGKGAVHIEGEVLGGLIKVNTKFQAEFGTKCALPPTNPFEDIPIVSEILPNDGDEDIYTGSDINVAFNFPNTTFTIDEYNEDAELTIRKFHYEIKKWELKHENEILPWQTHFYAPDGRSRKSTVNAYMPGESVIKYEIITKGYETTNGKELLSTQKENGSFTTKPRPDRIEGKNVLAMRPLGGKRFVLQEEYNKGWIQLKLDAGYLFNSGSPGSGFNKYVAQFKHLSTGQVTAEVPVTYDAGTRRINFDMSHDLVLNQIYGIEITRLHTPPINNLAANTNTVNKYKDYYITGGPGGGGINGNNLQNIEMNPQQQQQGNNNNQLNLNTLEANANQNQGNGIQQMQLNLNMIQNPNQGNGNGMALDLPLAQNTPPKPPGNNWGMIDGYIQAEPLGGEGVKIELLDRELLSSSETEKEMFNLFTYYWKTSKYKTWAEKMLLAKFANGAEAHSMSTLWKNSNKETVTQVNINYLELDENIDTYDAYGFEYKVGYHDKVIKPKLEFGFDYNLNWLTNQWNDGLNSPWQMPDSKAWGNPDFEVGSDILSYTIDDYPDFESYWPEEVGEDWEPNRFKDKMKQNPIFDHDDYPIPIGYQSWEENAPLEVYKNTKHGVFQLQGNPTMPAGILSKNEVQAAKSKAPNPQQQEPPAPIPWETLTLNQGNGGGGGGMAMGMNFESNPGKARIPIVEFQDWIAAHDYTWMFEFIMDGLTEELESKSQNEAFTFEHTVYNLIYWWISQKTSPPMRENYDFNQVKIGGQSLDYETKQIH